MILSLSTPNTRAVDCMVHILGHFVVECAAGSPRTIWDWVVTKVPIDFGCTETVSKLILVDTVPLQHPETNSTDGVGMG